MGEGHRQSQCNVVTTCYAGHTHGGVVMLDRFHMDSLVTATSFQR